MSYTAFTYGYFYKVAYFFREFDCSNPSTEEYGRGKKPQKGGKRPEVMTAFEIPEDIYADYCTPDEAKFGKENKNQRKVRIQKIERRWARE